VSGRWSMGGEKSIRDFWKNATDPRLMLRLVRDRTSVRKFRLFACACARVVLPFSTEGGEECVVVAERWADGTATADDRDRATRDAELTCARTANAEACIAAVVLATLWSGASLGAEFAFDHALAFEAEAFGRHPTETYLELVREVFGNPFRPIDFAPWRTDTAVTLSRQMYESREFGAMPILADALQDAGCDNEKVLRHCRDGGAHVRGCWVVDGVLEKE
jgi:hypothetical protein